MAKINIPFDGKSYSIDEATLASAYTSLRLHLLNTMNGDGATITFGDTAYGIDATKLSNATNKFISHLNTISGSGTEIVINDTIHAVDSTKLSSAVNSLHTSLGNLQNGNIVPGIYEAGTDYTVMTKSWKNMVADGDVHVEDGVLLTNFKSNANTSTEVLSGDLVLPTDSSITSFGQNAFRSCSKLSSITIPNSVTSFAMYAFYGCNNLKTVHVTDLIAWCNIEANGILASPLNYGHLYINGEALPADLEIPSGTTKIGAYAFYKCKELTSIKMPITVESISDEAFTSCTNLTKLYIDDLEKWLNVSFGGEQARPTYEAENQELYINNELVTHLRIPDGITKIPANMFIYCQDITDITIPNTVKEIGAYTFSYSGITNLEIPEGVVTIDVGAFRSCQNLSSITLPASATNLKNRPFERCSNVESISVAPENPSWRSANNCLIRKSSGTLELGGKNSEIPSDGTVTKIDYYAFYGHKGLTSITIPVSVTAIYDYAFAYCEDLTTMNYAGTMAQWNSMTRNTNWRKGSPFTEVICSDGTVTL